MRGHFISFCMAFFVLVPASFAQPAAEPPSGFSAPALGAPPCDESGPLEKKTTSHFGPDPTVETAAPAPETPAPDAPAASPPTDTQVKAYVDGDQTVILKDSVMEGWFN